MRFRAAGVCKAGRPEPKTRGTVEQDAKPRDGGRVQVCEGRRRTQKHRQAGHQLAGGKLVHWTRQRQERRSETSVAGEGCSNNSASRLGTERDTGRERNSQTARGGRTVEQHAVSTRKPAQESGCRRNRPGKKLGSPGPPRSPPKGHQESKGSNCHANHQQNTTQDGEHGTPPGPRRRA